MNPHADPAERLERFNQVMAHAKKAPFYLKRLPDDPLKSLEELKSIPLTTKADLRRESPFGLIASPRSELFQYHESFGTTGTPVSVWLTEADHRIHARELESWGVNFQQEDRVLIRFPYSISSAAHLVQAAAQWKQSCIIPAGARSTVIPFPKVIKLMRELKATVLTCLPLQALLIAETAEKLGLKPSQDFPDLRAIGTAGETLSPARRQMLHDIWGIPIYDHYGMTEIGAAVVDCSYGRPHPLEEYFIFELLAEDLQSEAIPGEFGQLVITTLGREATPLIRYLTGDRAKLKEQPCPCGRRQVLEVHGRQEFTIAVDNRVFDLWDLEEIISHLPCRRFWVAGPSARVCGNQGLELVVEQEQPDDRVEPVLVEDLKNKYRLNLAVKVVPKGTLYDRRELLEMETPDIPRYLYSAREIKEQVYERQNLKSMI